MSSQFVTTSLDKRPNSALPFVFTEQGVTQLSAVLRSDVAVEMSIRINDAFHAMRHRSSGIFSGDGAGDGERIDGTSPTMTMTKLRTITIRWRYDDDNGL